MEVTGSDPAFLAELIDLFIEDGEQQLATMAEALPAGNGARDDLRRAAHSLKGNSANFGATELNAVCLEIERSAHAGDPAAIGELLTKARVEFARVQSALLTVSRGFDAGGERQRPHPGRR